jgi:hypothetical protein
MDAGFGGGGWQRGALVGCEPVSEGRRRLRLVRSGSGLGAESRLILLDMILSLSSLGVRSLEGGASLKDGLIKCLQQCPGG